MLFTSQLQQSLQQWQHLQSSTQRQHLEDKHCQVQTSLLKVLFGILLLHQQYHFLPKRMMEQEARILHHQLHP